MSHPLLSLAARTARLLPVSLRRRLYQLGPFTRALRGVLNRAAPHGLTHIEVAAGGLEDLSLVLNMQTEKDYWLGTYEPELQAALQHFVKPGMVAYDVGANVGYISVLLGRLVGPSGRVYAFEALPANQMRLQTNLDLNDALTQFEMLPYAVVDTTGSLDFLVHASGGMGKAQGSAGREAESYAQTISVKAVSLDDFVYQQGHAAPQVVKVDVEGGEVLVLPGMRRLLAEARPLVLLELHGPQAAQVVWDELTAARYTLHLMVPEYPRVTTVEALDWKAYVIGRPRA